MRMKNIVISVVSLICLFFRTVFGNRIKYHFVSLISPSATIKTSKKGIIRFGYKNAVRKNSEISANGGFIEMGDNCFINRNCMIVSHNKITLGNNVTIGAGCDIFDHDHDGNGSFKSRPILIEDNVWIGSGSIVLKGVTIGHDSVIAAGSVICKNVPPNTSVIQKRVSDYRIRNV